jgi:hypothetical protein
LNNQTLVLSARGFAVWEIYNIGIPSAFLPSKSDLSAYFSFIFGLLFFTCSFVLEICVWRSDSKILCSLSTIIVPKMGQYDVNILHWMNHFLYPLCKQKIR